MTTSVGDEQRALLRRASRVALGLLAVALVGAVAIGGRAQEHSIGDVPGRMIVQGIRPGGLPYVAWNSEYPVVVGLVQWIASWFGRTPLAFLLVTSALSAGMALVLVRLLVRATGPRVWHAILAPAFTLYALHNWDLFAVVPAVAGVLAFDAKRDARSGALLAFGACAKVFPAVFLPPLLARRVHETGWRSAVPLAASAAATAAFLNLPFVIGARVGWLYPFRFQGRRPITWGTLWSVPGRFPFVGSRLLLESGAGANRASIVALTVAIVALCAFAVRRQMSAVAIGAAATALFLLCNKVYSPNYDLWLVPWLALVPISRNWRRYLGTMTTGMFVVVFGYLHGVFSYSVALALVPFLVVGRAVALVALIAAAVAVSSTRRPGVSAAR